MAAQDPGELFDVTDAEGRPLGYVKPRALVHRDGDWHRSLHLWVVIARAGAPAQVLLQRRSLAKDTQPGALDLAVAGHLGAGEGVMDALREAREEIGLAVGPRDVTRLGVRRRAHDRPPIKDREVQEVFLTVTERPLSSLVPDPEEVQALLTVALPDALALCRGDLAEATATSRAAGAGSTQMCTLVVSDLAQEDDYFAVALSSIDRHLRGDVGEPWKLP